MVAICQQKVPDPSKENGAVTVEVGVQAPPVGGVVGVLVITGGVVGVLVIPGGGVNVRVGVRLGPVP